MQIRNQAGADDDHFVELRGVSIDDSRFATLFVRTLLIAARDARASDVHLDPSTNSFDVRWRLDGVLQPLTQFSQVVSPNVIARLKVLGGLLTYETARPQEGRICDKDLGVEVRISTFPSLHGERAVLRLLGATNEALNSLSQLGLPSVVLDQLNRHLAATSGAVLIVGPAGSGKTTTAYACLRHVIVQSNGGRSAASLEDPIEVAVDGVSQTQVNPAVEFDMATGLRSLLRLDPEVILVGEMRDRPTADVALQAALTGQLVVTTFHAGNCETAMNRLVEIGIPGYAVRNAVRFVVAQRLVRRLCNCAESGDVGQHAAPFRLEVRQCQVPKGCSECHQTGYQGRALIAEWRSTEDWDASIHPIGDDQLWTSAARLIEEGVTSPMEVVRVLGWR